MKTERGILVHSASSLCLYLLSQYLLCHLFSASTYSDSHILPVPTLTAPTLPFLFFQYLFCHSYSAIPVLPFLLCHSYFAFLLCHSYSDSTYFDTPTLPLLTLTIVFCHYLLCQYLHCQ